MGVDDLPREKMHGERDLAQMLTLPRVPSKHQTLFYASHLI